MTGTIFTLAHEAAFAAYAGFGALLAVRSARSWLVAFLLGAAAITALWAQISVAAYYGVAPSWALPLANILRDGSWLALCLAIMYPRGAHTVLWRALLGLTVVLVALQIGFDIGGANVGYIAGVRIDGTLVRMAATVLGIALVENISRNSSQSEFWALKHLVIGIACILAYQLITRVPEFLTHAENPSIAIAKPLIFLLALPLFVVSSIRFPNLNLRVHSSRAFVFHTATLIGAGIMLQGVAVAAWYVRMYGGSAGTVLSVTLLFGGVAAVAVALVSGGVRSRIRRFINENFFSLKYDYRIEWEKVIRALSLNPEQGSAERVLRTLCDLLDSPGGALWIHRASWHQLLPAAKLAFTSEYLPIPEDDPRLEPLRSEECAYLALTSPEDSPAITAWRKSFETAWLIVPLRYRSSVIGLAVLEKTRAPKTLDWEDETLMRIVGMQLGAYLVQEETAQSLADARQLEEFNKRFAFIVHDIKNSIGQLSLLVGNAAKFGHEQEFRDDMVATLGNTVTRLQQLLKSLTAVGTENVPGNRTPELIDLIAFLSEFTKQKSNLGHGVVLYTNCQSLAVELSDITNLRRVIEHVVTNATEASGTGKPVEINVDSTSDSVHIKITDHGSGMTEKFIAEELFRPMRTTKDGGFGIGAYQARELMRDLGGDIHVASKVDHGTSVTLSVPRFVPKGLRAE